VNWTWSFSRREDSCGCWIFRALKRGVSENTCLAKLKCPDLLSPVVSFLLVFTAPARFWFLRSTDAALQVDTDLFPAKSKATPSAPMILKTPCGPPAVALSFLLQPCASGSRRDVCTWVSKVSEATLGPGS